MLDLPIAESGAEVFGLHPEERRVRGVRTEIADTQASVELTRPFVTPITQDLAAGDPELLAFWKAEQGRFHYHYVTFRATFIPDDIGFDTARIAVQLEPSPYENAVIAWSMSPLLITDPSKVKD